MCRLLAFASVAPTTPVDLLADDLASFVALSREHADGWGMAWYDGDGELDLAKDVEPAHASHLLEKLARTTDADAMVLHLRRASPGLSLRGTTDSERYFHLLLAALDEAGDLERALPPLVELLDGRVHYTALNFVLLTERRLYAVCAFSPDEPMPHGEPDYYTIGYRMAPDAVVVGSTGCWGDRAAWQTLGNGQALVVDRGTLDTTVVDLG